MIIQLSKTTGYFKGINKLKILVFEFISGGGFAGQPLPPSLAAEGGLMLQALLAELTALPGLELLIPLDERCQNLPLPAAAERVLITSRQDVLRLLPEMIRQADAVWPIAPETDGILARIAEMTSRQQKILLLSWPEAVRLCTDKLATYRHLAAQGIPVVETGLFSRLNDSDFPQVIKPRDGVGCQGGLILENAQDYAQALAAVEQPAPYIRQPYLTGQAASLSCLCKQGQAWLLSYNLQHITVVDRRFHLTGCQVNAAPRHPAVYQRLVSEVAAAIPGLWGYIGIDLIETTADGPLVLEINPRLTTSYVGLGPAMGINVAAAVLALLAGEPNLPAHSGQSVEIQIH